MTAPSTRPGFTLLELILVIAVITMVFAVCYPSIDAMYGSYKVTAATDSIRRAMLLARAHAIEEGRPYRFAVVMEGSHYRVAPDQPTYWQGGAPSDEPALVLADTLPKGVRFHLGQGAPDPAQAPAERADAHSNAADVSSDAWTPLVTFAPDGTASQDLSIVLQVRGARPVGLTLRALTGNLSVKVLPLGGRP
jgi:prepilin-type N-terminal cleavage/methylation domain-containing protein